MLLREKIIELHYEGATFDAIAKALGCSTLLVAHVVRQVTDPDLYKAVDDEHR